MTIRRQIFLSVLPLFIGFGALCSAMSWWLQLDDALKAFNDTSQSLGISVAEFIEPADIAAVRAGTPLRQTRLGPGVDRLDRWGLVRRYYLLDPKLGTVLADTAPAGTPAPGAAEIQGLGPEEVRLLPMNQRVPNSITQPVISFGANGAVVVGVEMSADYLIASRARILASVVKNGLFACVLGIVIAAALGMFLRRNVRRLQSSAEKIGDPGFSHDAGATINEVADLGNTFGVMHSVHEEMVDMTRMNEGDNYRDERNLTVAFQSEFVARSAWAGGSAEVAWLGVGDPLPAMLAGAIEFGPARGVAFVGLAGAGGDLEAAIRARAAAAFLVDRLARRPAADAAVEASALFRLTQLFVVEWAEARLIRWSSGDGSDPAASSADWAGGRSVALNNLGTPNADRLVLYLARFPQRPLAALLDELPPLLEAAEPGVLLVLRRKP